MPLLPQQSRRDTGGTLRGLRQRREETPGLRGVSVMADGAWTAGGPLWRLLDPPAPAEVTFMQ